MRPWVVSAICAGWLVGVLVGSMTILERDVLLGALALAGALFVFSTSNKRVQLAALGLMVGVFGVWRANGVLVDDRAARAAWEPQVGARRSVRGVVDEVQPRGPFVRVRVGGISIGDRALRGFLQATVPAVSGLDEGAHVVLQGALVRPEELRPPGAALRGDPEVVFARRQVFAALRFPTISVEQDGAPSTLTRTRRALRTVLLQALPEPAAGLYSAFLLSFDTDLPRDLRDAAAATGILHLVAISGSHIAVLAGFLFWVATAAGVRRAPAMVLTGVATALFLLLVGLPESGVRSGIMAGVVLLAFLVGRQAAGLRALALAAALMTVHNPRILLGDVGFQLSALAVWGLLTIYPLLAERFRRVPDVFHVKRLFLLTIAAEVATLPVVAYTFGRIPTIGPLTNLAAGYLFIPLFACGAIVLLVGVLLPAALALVGPLAAALASTFLSIAALGSRVPFHALHLPPVSQSAFLAAVAVLLLGVHHLQALARVPRSVMSQSP